MGSASGSTPQEPSKVRRRLGQVGLVLLGAALAVGGEVFKERVIDVPDYRLSASICAPVTKIEAAFVDQTGKRYPVPNPEEPVATIYVRLENTGKKPIEGLEVVFEYEATGNFRLLDEGYGTKPEKGFGKIDLTGTTHRERRIRFALLNPGDVFEYQALGTRPVTVVAYAKFPGLSFYQKRTPGCDRGSR